MGLNWLLSLLGVEDHGSNDTKLDSKRGWMVTRGVWTMTRLVNRKKKNVRPLSPIVFAPSIEYIKSDRRKKRVSGILECERTVDKLEGIKDRSE